VGATRAAWAGLERHALDIGLPGLDGRHGTSGGPTDGLQSVSRDPLASKAASRRGGMAPRSLDEKTDDATLHPAPSSADDPEDLEWKATASSRSAT